jgi:hypothetical protein
MNDDVLSNIAGFCDVDSRRALGLPPKKLMRNAEFDLKLQELHRKIRVTFGPSWFDSAYEEWCIRLNNRFQVLTHHRIPNRRYFGTPVLDRCFGTRMLNVSFEYKRTGLLARCDSCKFANDGPRGKETIVCDTIMETLESFRSYFINKQWTIAAWHLQQLTPESVVALRKLGYVFAERIT